MGFRKKSTRQIFDPVRSKWIAAFPEERVRQELLKKMIEQLGFPRAHLAVEKELKELSRQSNLTTIPERRIDIVCFAPDFSPLLLVECKEKLIFESASLQLMGYNQYVDAPFLLLADACELRFSFQSVKEQKWLSFLPRYKDLIHAVHK